MTVQKNTKLAFLAINTVAHIILFSIYANSFGNLDSLFRMSTWSLESASIFAGLAVIFIMVSRSSAAKKVSDHALNLALFVFALFSPIVSGFLAVLMLVYLKLFTDSRVELS